MLPIIDAAPGTYASVHAILRQAGYTEEAIVARSAAASVAAAFESRPTPPPIIPPATAGDVIYRLFFEEAPVGEDTARGFLGEGAVDAMLGLQLVRRLAQPPAALGATVLLYPLRHLFIASDLSRDPAAPGQTYALAEDAVYPAITPNTSDFLSLLPESPRGRFLELCAGTGVAALLAARSCERAVAADITARATAIAAFNAKLNGLANVRAVCGDVWDAVGDDVFDRIAAHPPYAPALDPTYIYRDGGEDGERVTRRVLSGLGAHLAPGGRFHATCCLTERRDTPVERHVRAMLGEAGCEMDVLVVTSLVHDVSDYHFRMALGGELPLPEAERLARGMHAAGVERIVLCTMLIARHDAPRAPVTLRRQRGSGTTPAHVEATLVRAAALPAVPWQSVLAAKPQLSPHARLQVTNAPGADGWIPQGCVISVEAPFHRKVQAGTNLAMLLEACDGARTARDLYGWVLEHGGFEDDLTEERFAGVLSGLVDEGYLVLDETPPPAA